MRARVRLNLRSSNNLDTLRNYINYTRCSTVSRNNNNNNNNCRPKRRVRLEG